MSAALDGTLVDADAAWLLDHVPAAIGSGRRTLEEWLAIGERLAAVRDRMPQDQEYGAWCRQYNWFGSADRKANLSDALEAFRFTNGKPDELDGTQSFRELAHRGRQAKKQAKRAGRAAIGAPTSLNVDLRVGDFRDVLADVRCDAVITDPPYPREYLPLYKDLAVWAADVLHPGGLLAVMCGQTYLPQLLALMDGPLPYRWTLAYLTPGAALQVWAANVNTHWKPVFIYQRLDRGTTPWLGSDTVKSDGNDKEHHHWGQSESGMADLVARLTVPGQTIADPFMGAGTTCVAAVTSGRHFIGCDINPEHVETARGRLP